MGIKSNPLRYAHAEGHTDLCYSEDGQYIITCGNDGDVRIWSGLEDDNPNSHCVGEWALAVAFKEQRLYVATDNHAVQAYTYPAFDKDGIVTRFTAPVTQIFSNAKIDALGCASENMEAKICNPEGGAPIGTLTEHKGPVLSMCLCPQMKYVCTSCGDGMLRIWDIDTLKIMKEINCVPKINTFYSAKVLCRMDFEPLEGRFLAYPNNRELVLLDCESWNQTMTLSHESIKCAISQCKFSPCGKFLAGSTVAGQIAVWNIESGECLGVIEHPTSHNVCAMAWNPKGNGVLAYCDVAGQMGTIDNCNGKLTISSEQDGMDTEDFVDNLIERFESDDDDNAISLEKLKNETLGLQSDSESSRPPSRHTVVERAPVTMPPQPPFQPSATPKNLEHRFMCWNEVGVVRCHTAESGESSIDVEFHDASTHHGIHLNNYLNHTMASLSTTVLALACEAPSKVVCISLAGGSREWSVCLPDTEEATCVLATTGLVACATTSRHLRLFTTMGTQRQVISLAGPCVCLAGFGTTVTAVYHAADPGVSDQHLAMDIIAINGRQVRSKSVAVPVSSGARLRWAGASDAGSPCCYDSEGVLRLLDVGAGLWLPVADTALHCKGASDSWFIVSVSESSQQVRAILCRGNSYPATVPKPTVAQLPLQLPLCELDTEKSQYEEQLVRWNHTSADVEVKVARETALKLFAIACRSELEQKALELMELLKDDKLLPLAARYASRLGRVHLADKLTTLAESWVSDQDKLNVAQVSHFQDLDSQDAFSCTNDDMNTSIILQARPPVKKSESSAPIKPISLKASQGIRNPFRKQQDNNVKNFPNPLALTERNLIEVHSTSDVEENHDPMQPLENEKFLDWYNRNKSALEESNPELTPSDLTKVGIRTFKSLQPKANSNPKSNGTLETNSTSETNTPEVAVKRKLNQDASSTEKLKKNTPKMSKLSAFVFKKNTD